MRTHTYLQFTSTFLQATDPSRSRRVRDARKSASERVHCCFCSSPRQANSAILVNLDQKTSVRTQKIFNPPSTP